MSLIKDVVATSDLTEAHNTNLSGFGSSTFEHLQEYNLYLQPFRDLIWTTTFNPFPIMNMYIWSLTTHQAPIQPLFLN